LPGSNLLFPSASASYFAFFVLIFWVLCPGWVHLLCCRFQYEQGWRGEAAASAFASVAAPWVGGLNFYPCSDAVLAIACAVCAAAPVIHALASVFVAV
jgi:hypothetical protein